MFALARSREHADGVRLWCPLLLPTLCLLLIGYVAAEEPEAKEDPRQPDVPRGFRDLTLGTPRQRIRELVQRWGNQPSRSSFMESDQLFSFGHDPQYEAFAGFLARFEDNTGLTAEPLYRRNARLSALLLEAKEQPADQSVRLVGALVERYGPWASTDAQAHPLEASDEFMRLLQNSGKPQHVVWEWEEPDVRLIVALRGRKETFVSRIIYEGGMVSRARSAKGANETITRVLRERLLTRARNVVDAVTKGQDVAREIPHKKAIRFHDQTFEGRSVVYVVGVRSFNGDPWGDMQQAIAASIDALPEGVLFQVNGALPPGGLLPSAADTRALARHALQYGTQDFQGALVDGKWVATWPLSTDWRSLGDHLRAAAALAPDLMIVAVNPDTSAVPGPPLGIDDVITRAQKQRTAVHIFFWKFPGVLDAPSPPCQDMFPLSTPVWEPPGEFRRLARETGGSMHAYAGAHSFWGLGPRVTLRYRCRTKADAPEEDRTATGTLIYADEDYVGIQTDKEQGKEHDRWAIPRERVTSLQVRESVPATRVPPHVRTLLPDGSVKDGDAPAPPAKPKAP